MGYIIILQFCPILPNGRLGRAGTEAPERESLAGPAVDIYVDGGGRG